MTKTTHTGQILRICIDSISEQSQLTIKQGSFTQVVIEAHAKAQSREVFPLRLRGFA